LRNIRASMRLFGDFRTSLYGLEYLETYELRYSSLAILGLGYMDLSIGKTYELRYGFLAILGLRYTDLSIGNIPASKRLFGNFWTSLYRLEYRGNIRALIRLFGNFRSMGRETRHCLVTTPSNQINYTNLLLLT